MAGKLSEELEKNTQQQKELYREQYYANHGEYPPEETGCLAGLFLLILSPIIWLFKWMLKGTVWCFKWMFKGIFYMFKGMFYTFPRFLWSKGTFGKICCGTYIFSWGVVLFISGVGKDYVFRNWLYFIIILVSIIATMAITITFRLLDKQFTKRFAIALSSGIFAVVATVIIGIFLTKHLIPLEGEIKFIGNKNVNENTQSELFGG